MKKLILMLLFASSINANPPKVTVAVGTVMGTLALLVGYYAIWCAAHEA